MKPFKHFFSNRINENVHEDALKENILMIRKITSQSPFNFKWYYDNKDIKAKNWISLQKNLTITLAARSLISKYKNMEDLHLFIKIYRQYTSDALVLELYCPDPNINGWLHKYPLDQINNHLQSFQYSEKELNRLVWQVSVVRDLFFINKMNLEQVQRSVEHYRRAFELTQIIYNWPVDINDPKEAIKFLEQQGLPKKQVLELKIKYRVPIDPNEIDNKMIYQLM